jgi:hypothetical protein
MNYLHFRAPNVFLSIFTQNLNLYLFTSQTHHPVHFTLSKITISILSALKQTTYYPKKQPILDSAQQPTIEVQPDIADNNLNAPVPASPEYDPTKSGNEQQEYDASKQQEYDASKQKQKDDPNEQVQVSEAVTTERYPRF